MKTALLLVGLALVSAPAAAPAAAQRSAREAEARERGYPSYEAYYCHIYGETTTGGKCPAASTKRRKSDAVQQSDACEAAWVECWNMARASRNMARQTQCTAERSRCRSRLKR